ncbi:MAG: hypothetical protein PVH24_07980 [Candidatus Zixiibacteriota bacterium]|jgi:hypothetical protein
MKTNTKSVIVILFIGLTTSQCNHLIKDETNFSQPALARCRTIAVPASSHYVDMYLPEALAELWPGVVVLGPDSVAAGLKAKGTTSLREIGADAVVLQSASVHYYSPTDDYFDPRRRAIIDITTYVVELATNDTLACYHNQGSYRTDLWDPGDYHRKFFGKIVKNNIRGLVELAISSGHLTTRSR